MAIFPKTYKINSKNVIQEKFFSFFFYFEKHPKNKFSWLRPILVYSLLVKLANPLSFCFCRLTEGNDKNQALEDFV